MQDFSEKLAARLGKNLRFELTGAETLVDVETMRPVAQAVSHLVRNAVDHGLESPAQRDLKPPTGTIGLVIEEQEQTYVLDVKDDDQGVNVDVLGARAIRLGFNVSIRP